MNTIPAIQAILECPGGHHVPSAVRATLCTVSLRVIAASLLATVVAACGGSDLPSVSSPLTGNPGTTPGTPPPPTPADSVAPTQPAALVATADGPFRVSLSWQASTDNVAVTAYRIERCLVSACVFAETGTTAATTFLDTGLTAATDYRYRVRARDAAGNLSSFSTPAVATTDNAPAPPPLATLPPWVAALAPGQWYEIPNTAMSSVAPVPVPPGITGPRSKVDAWTSFVVDRRTSKVYSAANGGHADYAGNEVNVLDLEIPQPVWSEVIASSPNAQIPPAAVAPCPSYYLDGLPTSRHSYYGVTLDEAGDRIILFGGAHWCQPGGFHNAVSSYDISLNSWSPAASHPEIPQAIRGGVPAYAFNPANGDVYGAFNFSLVRWNRATNSFTVLSPTGSPAAGDEAMSAFDTTRDRVLFLSNIARHYYTPATNAWTQVALSGPSASTVAARQGALIYVEAIDLFLVRLGGAGGAVYQIDPVSFVASPFPGGGATTGGAPIPATLNGPYNKFLYVPRLQGAVYVPSYSANAWFLRIH